MNLYDQPSLYDLEYEAQTEDVVYYVKQASRSKGPVLELGCGNGRITLPIARSGVQIIGLDNNRHMLDHLMTKLKNEPNRVASQVSVIESDYKNIPECGPFPLILLPFNALHHCSTHLDVMKLFSSVRAQLAPQGRFILDCYLPDPILYQRDPSRRYAEQTMIDPRTHRTLTSWETSQYDPLTQEHHVTYTYQEENGDKWSVELKLRMFYPQELRALIDLSGFKTIAESSDFRNEPLSGQSLKWVMELQAQ